MMASMLCLGFRKRDCLSLGREIDERDECGRERPSKATSERRTRLLLVEALVLVLVIRPVCGLCGVCVSFGHWQAMRRAGAGAVSSAAAPRASI